MEFNNKIKLSYEENSELREKRDILLKDLKDNMADDVPKFSSFMQGSYAMHTGINPDNSDFDIDIGLEFEIDKDDYLDPVKVKTWVKDALVRYARSVEIRRSCVTVTYQRKNEPIFHVDFAIYAASNKDNKLYIAKGKENSIEEKRYWELSNPHDLIKLVNNKFQDKDDMEQYRRVIKYLKKWKSIHFKSAGNEAPTGIALTILAYHYFNPAFEVNNYSGNKIYIDLLALENLALSIKKCFKLVQHQGVTYNTISLNLPVEPFNNLFEKMTLLQQDGFYKKIVDMLNKLNEVKETSSRAKACQLLIDIFGEDFPQTVDRSFVGTAESA